MAGPKEKMALLEEFMRNTGADKSKALNILNRNHWKLKDSYLEIEKMCISSGQRNVQPHHNQPNREHSPIFGAIEIGRGLPVRVHDKNISLPNQTVSPKSPQTSLPLNSSKDPTSNLGFENLSVKLPCNKISDNSRLASGQCSDALNQHSPQVNHPRVPGEATNPSQPSMAAPIRTDRVDMDEANEEDDVFDEKFQMKKPLKFNSYPRLKRGFSNIIENEDLVSEARHNVKKDILKDSHDNMYVQTFVLPNLAAYKEGFRAFIEKELIETSTLVSLEQAGRLNWWAEMGICQRLMPMATSGDGNCLLHAASLAMWGIHDRQLILRNELYETLTKARYKDALYRRWRYQQMLGNKESGLVFSEAEWREEWDNVLRLASPLPRGIHDVNRQNNCCDSVVTHGVQEEPVVYESLEEFHVFVLAHVLQRPIIVVADTFLKSSSGEALAPIPFSGIYLPFEVHPCYRSPLLLTYDAAHFSALAPVEQEPDTSPMLPAAIPLVDPQLKLLPLHFCVDPLSNISKNAPVELTIEDKVNLLKKMLDVEKIPLHTAEMNGDSDLGSSGSHESDESGGTNGKEKDKKKEDKKKHGQTVAKQFGSLGKTVGKKLKQLGKGNKDKPRRPCITQSTAITSLDHYSPKDVVFVARLSEKRGKQQQEMIQNYLQDAEARFKLDYELKRKSDIELRSKIAPHPAVSSTTLCKTPGCSQIGVPEANFLCSKCNAAKQREDLQSNSNTNAYSYNTFPGRVRQNLAPDEIFCYGNSKFYTSSSEDVNNPGPSGDLNVSNSKVANSVFRSSGNVNQMRRKSPPPDYDDVPHHKSHNTLQKSNKAFVNDLGENPTEERKQCTTAGCEFYGSRSSDYLCSKCYQKKYQEIMHLSAQNATKL